MFKSGVKSKIVLNASSMASTMLTGCVCRWSPGGIVIGRLNLGRSFGKINTLTGHFAVTVI